MTTTSSEPMPNLRPAAPDHFAPGDTASGNPASLSVSATTKANAKGGANMYGFASIETFCSQSGLSLTHDDAKGFYDYVKQFTAPNFWYQDAGVKPWLYYEEFDNWQNTYGADAVRAFYHSGHGGMGADGTFYLPMGADWGGLGCTVTSDKMRLGNEFCRYLFWSTCLSLRVGGGQSPNKTWNAANLGLRMIFGYETVSYDNANYGSNFFKEWNKNKSFSQAFLDASWGISHDQTATVTACGATQQEAQSRLFNERHFESARVSKNWWWWRWMGAVAAREAVTSVPQHLQHAALAPAHLSAAALQERFEMGGTIGEDGASSFVSGDRAFTRAADGSFSVQMAAANLDNEQALSLRAVRAATDRLIDRLALAGSEPLIVDRVMYAQAAGGTGTGSGEMAGTRTTETIVQYRQTIDGIPIISPSAGALRVAVDNDGNVTRVEGSLREVREVSSSGRRTPPQQPEPASMARADRDGVGSPEPMLPHEAALAAKAGDKLRMITARGGRGPVGMTIVPGSTEIGYVVNGDDAQLVATRGIEVDFGSGYKKRYQIETPLFS